MNRKELKKLLTVAGGYQLWYDLKTARATNRFKYPDFTLEKITERANKVIKSYEKVKNIMKFWPEDDKLKERWDKIKCYYRPVSFYTNKYKRELYYWKKDQQSSLWEPECEKIADKFYDFKTDLEEKKDKRMLLKTAMRRCVKENFIKDYEWKMIVMCKEHDDCKAIKSYLPNYLRKGW